MVRAGKLQEGDIQEESGAADLFRQGPGAKDNRSNGIPDGHMGGNVNLLR